jgi:hypothetical protein
MIARTGELGASLLGQIKPSTAPRPAPTRSPESILRDQLAQLVVDRYDELEVLTVVAIGKRKAAELLPALRSFAVSRTKATTEPARAHPESIPKREFRLGEPGGNGQTGPFGFRRF